MISHIEVKNFKSLKKVSVNTQNLNVLMGLNGMGKSSFIQTLLLLMQSDKLEERVIDLNGILADIGQGKDALYQYAEEDIIEFLIDFGFESVEQIFLKYLEKNNFKKTPERIAILKEIYSIDGSFDIDELYNRMKQSNKISPATFYNTKDILLKCNLIIEHKHINNKARYEKVIYSRFHWRFLYQKDKDKLIAEVGYRKTAMEYFRNQTKSFQYIRAERIGPQEWYNASTIVVSDKKQIGLVGEYAAHYINVFG